MFLELVGEPFRAGDFIVEFRVEFCLEMRFIEHLAHWIHLRHVLVHVLSDGVTSVLR